MQVPDPPVTPNTRLFKNRGKIVQYQLPGDFKTAGYMQTTCEDVEIAKYRDREK